MPEITNIRSLSEIPPEERYALVMSGLSTYDTIHTRGATFTVNDGLLNPRRSADMAQAMSKARQFAEDHKLLRVYVLE